MEFAIISHKHLSGCHTGSRCPPTPPFFCLPTYSIWFLQDCGGV